MMKAIVVNEQRQLIWTDVPEPVLRDDQVIIDVHATGVNRADLFQRDGKYPSPPGWPPYMGLEVSGVISEAPSNSSWRVGEKVCALLGGGGYAQRVAVPSGLVLSAPANLPLEQAAALPEVFATAYLNLVIEAGLKSGETVFIQAGASGVGIAAIHLAMAIGAKVVTSVGSEEKAKFLRQLGADVVINRKTTDIASVLKEHPIDVALDCVAGPSLGSYLECMSTHGRWVIISTLGGERAELPLRTILRRGLKIFGSTLRSRSDQEKSDILFRLESEIWPRIEQGQIAPVIYKMLPLEKAEEAHAILRDSKNTGKVILTQKLA
ncbi:MAG: NAD(P)H-quinone oxidoreductase [Lentisphaeria bacterium]|jgi:NADPH2:quinone reductase